MNSLRKEEKIVKEMQQVYETVTNSYMDRNNRMVLAFNSPEYCLMFLKK